MKHWELAPANAARLADYGIPFAITADGLTNKNDFWKNLRKSGTDGTVGRRMRLRHLPTLPPDFVRAEEQLGSLRPGRVANFSDHVR